MKPDVSLTAACGVFGSRSVAAHLLRGAIAATLLTWVVFNYETRALLALIAGGGAVVAMRGCPMCWTVGLVETIASALWRPKN